MLDTRHFPVASIIVTCYNYENFVRQCIDSALSQSYPHAEVIVVDDGSTDNSAAVISSFGDRIVPIFKPNAGMASAFNAGFAASRGNIVCFLDADDSMYREAVRTATELFVGQKPVKVHWPLDIVDGCGKKLGLYPSQPLGHGALLDDVVKGGPEGYVWSVTSGNAWDRSFLEKVMPIPEEEYRFAAESYLAALAPAFGPIARIPHPMGTYRMHGRSLSYSRLISERMRQQTRQYRALGDMFARLGIDVDVDSWHPPLRFRERVTNICLRLESMIAPGSRFIFVEWSQWGPGRVVSQAEALPFLERDAQYIGTPESDAVAIGELERMRAEGAGLIVFAWPALWWLEYYSGFYEYLQSRYRRVYACDDLVVFDLGGQSSDARAAEVTHNAAL